MTKVFRQVPMPSFDRALEGRYALKCMISMLSGCDDISVFDPQELGTLLEIIDERLGEALNDNPPKSQDS